MRDGDVKFLSLDLSRGFDEGCRHARFDVPLDVAVEELDARVVGQPTDGDGAVAGHQDRIAAHGGCAGCGVVREQRAAS